MHSYAKLRSFRIVFLILMFSSFESLAIARDGDKQTRSKVSFTGSIVDADTKQAIAARVYLRDSDGNWLFVRSASENGSAWPYSEAWVPMPNSVEQHTTVSGHPFTIDLAPGDYQILIERGKEYLPLAEKLTIANVPTSSDDQEPKPRQLEKTFAMQRWSNIAEKGWYSGETHVHRRIAELPNVMSAEELNVAFPVTFWTTSSDRAPNLEPSSLRSQGPSPFGPREDAGYDPIWVNPQTVIVPRNTEYEIFSIGQKRHTLGAIFILNHRSPFQQQVPPVTPVIEQARREGALLDLDKHNWPWSLMLVPVAKVDLFELSNNSVWRTNFGFKQAGHALPPWREFEQEAPGVLTEWGWLQFSFEMYYALLNCGFKLSPTAGTASGVHPVPLGYSRVYVHTGDKFNLSSWLEGLQNGRSFVTTGPMLIARVNQQLPGQVFQVTSDHSGEVSWEAEVTSPEPISRVEIIVNGQVKHALTPPATKNQRGTFNWSGKGRLGLREGSSTKTSDTNVPSSWVAIRTWSDQADGRKRFAHTGIWHFEVDKKAVQPPIEQIDYLLRLLDETLERQRAVLQPEALAEFEKARDVYREIRTKAAIQPATNR